MNRRDVLVMALGMFSAATAQTTAAPVKIKVLVYEYAKLAEFPLSESLGQAARVFRKAGVEVEWCVGKEARDECFAAVQSSGTPFFMLNLLDVSMASREPMGLNRPGFARGNAAYISGPCVQKLVSPTFAVSPDFPSFFALPGGQVIYNQSPYAQNRL